jgi:hypothetical protein
VGNDVGHASALDSALLVVMWGACFGALQGAAICTAEELRLDSYRGCLERLLPQVQEQVSHHALASLSNVNRSLLDRLFIVPR